MFVNNKIDDVVADVVDFVADVATVGAVADVAVVDVAAVVGSTDLSTTNWCVDVSYK